MLLKIFKKIVSFTAALCILLLYPAHFVSAEKWTIGVVMTANIPYYAKMHKAFLARLAREGFGNAEILLQRPSPDTISWSNAARKIIAVDADIIVTYGSPATIAAINENPNIPIVFTGVSSSTNISGRKITGVTSKVPVSSLFRYLKGLSGISSLGVLYSESERDSVKQTEELASISKDLGFKIVRIDIRRLDDVKKIKTAGKLDALFLTNSAAVNLSLDSIIDIARVYKLPTASVLKGEYESGVIVTLSASPEEQGELAAEKVARIMRGGNPGAIPQTGGKDIELIFNMKEGMSLGFKVPMGLVTEATKIIQ